MQLTIPSHTLGCTAFTQCVFHSSPTLTHLLPDIGVQVSPPFVNLHVVEGMQAVHVHHHLLDRVTEMHARRAVMDIQNHLASTHSRRGSRPTCKPSLEPGLHGPPINPVRHLKGGSIPLIGMLSFCHLSPHCSPLAFPSSSPLQPLAHPYPAFSLTFSSPCPLLLYQPITWIPADPPA